MQFNLKRLRLKKGLSFRKLAKLAGVSTSTIYKLEAGQLSSVETKTLERLCNALECTLADLMA